MIILNQVIMKKQVYSVKIFKKLAHFIFVSNFFKFKNIYILEYDKTTVSFTVLLHLKEHMKRYFVISFNMVILHIKYVYE